MRLSTASRSSTQKRDVHLAYLAWIGRYVRSLLDAAIFSGSTLAGKGCWDGLLSLSVVRLLPACVIVYSRGGRHGQASNNA
ncbi:hypothetical protein LMG28727_06731 [Paraburkholderia kirstenboschensis]|nr:hypothetical protein LMG28727_06731 [Paraburkholderia kirstenboschensis]